VEFFDRLDAVHRRWNVLEHQFYVRWSNGELTAEELAFYAGEYTHAVVALADGLAETARRAEPELRAEIERHASEEAEHVDLWDRFADATGAAKDVDPRPETRACVESWTAGRDALEGLVAAYAVESAQPAISRTKLEGLVQHYGFEEGPATEYSSRGPTRSGCSRSPRPRCAATGHCSTVWSAPTGAEPDDSYAPVTTTFPRLSRP
jgi:pyrroloquinoline-quinone synthase